MCTYEVFHGSYRGLSLINSSIHTVRYSKGFRMECSI
jgi:hypothetical protein